MLGLRFYACSQCDTVHAGPTVPLACPVCDAEKPEDITRRLQDDTYFTTPNDRDQ